MSEAEPIRVDPSGTLPPGTTTIKMPSYGLSPMAWYWLPDGCDIEPPKSEEKGEYRVPWRYRLHLGQWARVAWYGAVLAAAIKELVK